MILKSPLTKLLNSWVWSTGLILVFGASSWGVEEGLIKPRIRKEKDWNLEAQRLERRVHAILPQFPDLETLRRRLKQQQSELDRLQKEASLLDKKVLGTSALKGFLEGGGAAGGIWQVNPLGPGEDRCRMKPYACDTFEVQGRRDFDTLVQYLDSLEGSSPLLEILEIVVDARGPGGAQRPEVKIRVKAIHSPGKSKNVSGGAQAPRLKSSAGPFSSPFIPPNSPSL